MRMSALLVGLTLVFVVHASSSHAQTSHSAPQSAIDAALQQKVSSEAADREMVLRLLDRPEVRAVAGDAGIDLRTAKDAVGTIDGKDLAAITAQAAQVEQALAGGQSSVTISTTFLIIALLVLIVLILVLK